MGGVKFAAHRSFWDYRFDEPVESATSAFFSPTQS